ncbi:hypothetical protein B4U79_16973 [Dinothrombium tinctorium]|uniref:DRBM domain-containing protein n=1 Tax=Dinothrombium tinctorium TaxID=1965070 RepID=A0A3S4Q7B3_9ACAR|nr:hypothetical protein B4U79_16973 [Dinothrombium tinctorium]
MCLKRRWNPPRFETSLDLENGRNLFVVTCSIDECKNAQISGKATKKKEAKREAASQMIRYIEQITNEQRNCDHFPFKEKFTSFETEFGKETAANCLLDNNQFENLLKKRKTCQSPNICSTNNKCLILSFNPRSCEKDETDDYCQIMEQWAKEKDHKIDFHELPLSKDGKYHCLMKMTKKGLPTNFLTLTSWGSDANSYTFARRDAAKRALEFINFMF